MEDFIIAIANSLSENAISASASVLQGPVLYWKRQTELSDTGLKAVLV